MRHARELRMLGAMAVAALAANAVLAATPTPLPEAKESMSSNLKGIFHPCPDGTYTYESDVYRVVFDSDGRISSLAVRGREFLRTIKGAVGGAGFFHDGRRMSLPTVQPSPDGGLVADGKQGVFLHMEADRLDIDVGQETPEGRIEFVFFPADGIRMTAVENPSMRGSRNEKWQIVGKQATRWTAPDGTFIELHYDSAPTNSYNGAPAMPVNVPYKTRICGELRFPQSAWGDLRATVEMKASVEDHNFAAGQPIGISADVTLRNTLPAGKQLAALIQFEDMNTLTVAGEERLPLSFPDGKKATLDRQIDWKRAGPWHVSVTAIDGDRVIGIKRGVVVYDLDHYTPALARPADFWDFWQDALKTQRSLPLDPVLTRDDKASTNEYDIYTVYITGYMGRRLQGSYAEPAAAGLYPVTLGAGHPGSNVTAPAEGRICNLVTYMDGMATYRTGMGSRRTSNLFYNYIDALRWMDFLATRPRADLTRSIYYAGSRSGPVGIAVLALDPRLRMYIANVPTNNRWDWQATYPGAGAWGPWATDRLPGQSIEDFARELSYFNSDNFAERITQPVLIGFGLLDGLSQVTGNLACYARLASTKKKICIRPWWGHADATPEWYDISAKWRKELFEGNGATPH